MVSRTLLNMKNISNIYSITSILISLYSKNTSKYGCYNNPSESKEENYMRPSLSRYDNNRRQRQDFLGHLLQSQGSMSKNFREYPITGNKGKKRARKTARWADNKKTRRQKRRPLRNLGVETRAARLDKRHQRNPQERISIDFKKWTRIRSQGKKISKVFGIHLVKLKKPNGQKIAVIDIRYNIWEENPPHYQPQEGPLLQAQDK